MKDLIVLADDKSMKLVMEALLGRAVHLRLRAISFDAVAHPENDPGIRLRAHNFLRSQLRNYGYAIAICDRSGSGRENLSREKIEERIEAGLQANGWENRAIAIVIDPELENWMWGDWNVSSEALRWVDAHGLREWLIEQDLLSSGRAKPKDPKRALKCAAKCSGKRWSSSIHQQIAAQARIDGCTDPAFLKLRSNLQNWFPIAT
jgi:hypothetical protein